MKSHTEYSSTRRRSQRFKANCSVEINQNIGDEILQRNCDVNLTPEVMVVSSKNSEVSVCVHVYTFDIRA